VERAENVGERHFVRGNELSEQEFWKALQDLINCLPIDNGRPVGWCDWFSPKRYVLDGPTPHIDGYIGFVSGRNASSYGFTLILPIAAGSRSLINWERAIRKLGSASWVSLDEHRNRLVIDLSTANT
jgi:hypothetical protein